MSDRLKEVVEKMRREHPELHGIRLGPRQQFIDKNGRRQKLVSKKKAWEIIEQAGRP